jgi:hypothetical protein
VLGSVLGPAAPHWVSLSFWVSWHV